MTYVLNIGWKQEILSQIWAFLKDRNVWVPHCDVSIAITSGYSSENPVSFAVLRGEIMTHFFSFLALISAQTLDGFSQQTALATVQRSWEPHWTSDLHLIWFFRPLISEGAEEFFLVGYSPDIPFAR